MLSQQDILLKYKRTVNRIDDNIQIKLSLLYKETCYAKRHPEPVFIADVFDRGREIEKLHNLRRKFVRRIKQMGGKI